MAIKPELFKQVRKKLGLSQQELADALGLSRVTVNKMERGRLRRGIPDEIAARLLALKKKSESEPTFRDNGAALWKRPSRAVRNVNAAHERSEDAHLWDNGEDEHD